MYTTYDDALTATLTATQAALEIADHSLSFADFQQDCGVSATYSGATVLNWLGY